MWKCGNVQMWGQLAIVLFGIPKFAHFLICTFPHLYISHLFHPHSPPNLFQIIGKKAELAKEDGYNQYGQGPEQGDY